MAVYNPIIVSPTSGVAIDAILINRFEWNYLTSFGDTTPQSSYKVDIYDFDNNLIHTSGSIGSSNEYYDLPATTLTNGNQYKWEVTINVSRTNRQKSIFQTQDTPVATVDTLPDPFIHQFYNFTGTVTQVQGVGIKSFQWYLYNASDVQIATSGEIIGSTVEYEFTGLDNATTYKVDYDVEIQSGLTTTSDRLSFITDYTAPVDPDAFVPTGRDDIGMNKLDWSAIVTQIGTVDGTFSYITGVFGLAIEIDENSCLNYDLNSPIPEIFSGAFFIKLASGYDSSFIKLYKDNELIYQAGYSQDFGGFYYDRKGRRVHSVPISMPTDWFQFMIKPRYIGYNINDTEYILR